ncbi:DsrE family protein [Hyphococcus sp.]|uniref:DsrE family protein n=1 Tax=Hyphococcus sp. TaxID=2038636 RepID=UPI002083CF34|nr:MAG: hypothetical protein DHS20C04_20630 [Marinicaulis sp.]
MKLLKFAAALMLNFTIIAPGAAGAQQDKFTTGPVFKDFGPVADVETTFAIPKGITLKTSFDVRERGEAGAVNGGFVSAARFINMHARAGVPLKKIKVAIVVHGGAVDDVTTPAHYGEEVGGENANAPLIAALIDEGVRIIVCGQSAAYHEVDNDELLPGVEMALSAMTAHAVLQRQGYAINPF